MKSRHEHSELAPHVGSVECLFGHARVNVTVVTGSWCVHHVAVGGRSLHGRRRWLRTHHAHLHRVLRCGRRLVDVCRVAVVTTIDERRGCDAVGVDGVVERGDRAHAVTPRGQEGGQGTSGRLHGDSLCVVSVCVNLLLRRDVWSQRMCVCVRRRLGVQGHGVMRVWVRVRVHVCVSLGAPVCVCV